MGSHLHKCIWNCGRPDCKAPVKPDPNSVVRALEAAIQYPEDYHALVNQCKAALPLARSMQEKLERYDEMVEMLAELDCTEAVRVRGVCLVCKAKDMLSESGERI